MFLPYFYKFSPDPLGIMNHERENERKRWWSPSPSPLESLYYNLRLPCDEWYTGWWLNCHLVDACLVQSGWHCTGEKWMRGRMRKTDYALGHSAGSTGDNCSNLHISSQMGECRWIQLMVGEDTLLLTVNWITPLPWLVGTLLGLYAVLFFSLLLPLPFVLSFCLLLPVLAGPFFCFWMCPARVFGLFLSLCGWFFNPDAQSSEKKDTQQLQVVRPSERGREKIWTGENSKVTFLFFWERERERDYFVATLDN